MLFFSKEYIKVSNSIAGTFHSKVGRVCQGLGHISTTLDPTWQGQLIISVNNPTSKEIQLELDENSGNIFTLLLYKFNTPVVGTNIHDNNSGRCDLLLKHFLDSPDRKFKEKHLQLKEYVLKDFADSLNGYDDFLNKDIEDEYTQKVKKLLELKKRLKRDEIIIREGRYVLENGGKYRPLIDQEEIDLVVACTLFKLNPEMESDNLNREFDREELINGSLDKMKNDSVLMVLSKFQKIIDYELGMINHIRRVNWQNEKSIKFAGEESELVMLRKRSIKMCSLIKIAFGAVVIAALISIYILIKKNQLISDFWSDLAVPIMVPIFLGALKVIRDSWKELSKYSRKRAL